MTSLPPEAKYAMEPFQCLPTILDWRYIDFQTGHFSVFEQFQVDFHFDNSGQVKN